MRLRKTDPPTSKLEETVLRGVAEERQERGEDNCGSHAGVPGGVSVGQVPSGQYAAAWQGRSSRGAESPPGYCLRRIQVLLETDEQLADGCRVPQFSNGIGHGVILQLQPRDLAATLSVTTTIPNACEIR